MRSSVSVPNAAPLYGTGAVSEPCGPPYADGRTRRSPGSAGLRLEVGEGSVTAVVHGTDVYEVELTLGGGEGITGWCDCPYGQEGNFCKHCMAVG